MDVKVFKTFLEVARTRHFGRAAENLYLTQSAVSTRIKQLEAYFDTALFIRDRHGIKLTESGQQLTEHARLMVGTLARAKDALSQRGDSGRQLMIAGSPGLWEVCLRDILLLLNQRCQDYSLIAGSGDREQLQQGLLKRTLDIAITTEQLKNDELTHCDLPGIELCLVSTRDSSLTNALAEQYVLVDWGRQFAAEHASRHPRLPAPALRTASARIALDFILGAGGTAYLPRPLVVPLLKSGRLFIVKDAAPWRCPLYLSHRKDAASLSVIQQLRQSQP